MEKFDKIKGIAAPMMASDGNQFSMMINIDTDMIIPKQFLKTIKRTGLGKNLFHEMRFDFEGNEVDSFILNKDIYRDSKILLAGNNFGCGSSREHAPWALLDFGIKVIIAPSFADIFFNNCFKNGILPIKLSEKVIKELSEIALSGSQIEVILDDQKIFSKDLEISFEIDISNKNFLMEGLDDIGLTLKDSDLIDSYEKENESALPWYSIKGDLND
ncbi:MAG: 3-isopropylmalate dehydratase small subunit [Pseudomonadota bacterium]|nr:3-isopropylmalate dehydratase small subunit [Pseudomonadota bacterium]MEC9382512.1 3-isopropylmalate dehydratase small subunit [Pseudomonadota bacterium]MEC9392751.1 3-isopropylmalate dehydratase small subunit [Pseudomonadota bacterium]MEC9459258.1 3-isopropylmalate dehydratase small subunit [Pseudomonadota bacterium]MED5437265.1 3-isopropylmalate dehydratase small subunit [Pseudomonadota bacterium]